MWTHAWLVLPLADGNVSGRQIQPASAYAARLSLASFPDRWGPAHRQMCALGVAAMAHGYTLDNAWVHARERLGRLEAHFDPGSIRHLERLGVAGGWHCLEVAAGGGSIATWLSRKVGATGRVVATDIDTRFLDGLDYPNVEVRRHDIVERRYPRPPSISSTADSFSCTVFT